MGSGQEAARSTLWKLGETASDTPAAAISSLAHGTGVGKLFTRDIQLVDSATDRHLGPSHETDAYWKTTAVRVKRRGDFADSFHTFGLEWTEKYMYTYYDSRLTQVLYTDFWANNPLWSRGSFAEKSENNTLFTNPWNTSTSQTGNAPFDQKFYMVLNVAVGARNGWFL